MNQFPPSPRVSFKERFEFFRKFTEIFKKIQGAPPVSMTPVVNFPQVSTPVANLPPGINDTSGNLPLV
jgi:hypothetical protein